MTHTSNDINQHLPTPPHNNRPTSAVAPGKLFLFGEYAVVAGCWSIVAAVGIGARIHYNPTQKGYTVYNGDLYETDSRLSAMPSAVLKEAQSSLKVAHIGVDLSQLYYEGEKLGVGSSAASCAGIAALAMPTKTPQERFLVAAEAHRKFQKGRGSHADVAASCLGGIQAYRLLKPVPPFQTIAREEENRAGVETLGFAQVKKLHLPPELELYGYWTGVPANSRSKLLLVEQTLKLSGTQQALQAIRSASMLALESFEGGDALGVIEALKLGRQGMYDLEHATGVWIWTEKATRLEALLYDIPVEVKMSGAGGGDFAIVGGVKGTIEWDEVVRRVGGYWLKITDDVLGASCQ